VIVAQFILEILSDGTELFPDALEKQDNIISRALIERLQNDYKLRVCEVMQERSKGKKIRRGKRRINYICSRFYDAGMSADFHPAEMARPPSFTGASRFQQSNTRYIKDRRNF